MDYQDTGSYQLILDRDGYHQLKQLSLMYQEQMLQLQRQLDTERKMRRIMALQLQKSNAQPGKYISLIVTIGIIHARAIIDAIVQQQSEVLKELCRYSDDVNRDTVKRDVGVQFTFMEPVSGITMYNMHCL